MNNADTILIHLVRERSITPMEAMTVHKIARLAPRIKELRDCGFEIETQRCKDVAGDVYFRYVFEDHASRSRAGQYLNSLR